MLLEYVNLDRIESLGLLRIDEFWDGGIGASLSALKHVELLFEPLEHHWSARASIRSSVKPNM